MYPKRINLWSIGLVLFAQFLCLPIQAAQWATVRTGDPATIYHDVYFTDADHGWIVGGNGSGGFILRTINGGFNDIDWTEQTTTGAALWKLFFLDASNGWAVGDNSTILYTTNGGDSWATYSITGLTGGDSLRGAYFNAADTGWVATLSPKAIYYRADVNYSLRGIM